MKINKETSFIETYFDNKDGDMLMKTITPAWSNKNMNYHLSLIGVPKDAKTVFEVGAGIGRLLKPIAENGKQCIGIDASTSMVKESINYLKDVNAFIYKCDGEGNIYHNDDSFDFSYSIITFQHIPNTETIKKYISEMVRITKPGGEIMFQVLANNENKGYLWSYHDVNELLLFLYDMNIKKIDYEEINNWGIIRCKI